MMTIDQYRAKQLSAGAQAHGLLSSMLETGCIHEHHVATAQRIVDAWPKWDQIDREAQTTAPVVEEIELHAVAEECALRG